MEVETPKDQLIIRKENHGDRVYWFYGIHHFMDTSALDVKFGVAKHFFREVAKSKPNQVIHATRSSNIYFLVSQIISKHSSNAETNKTFHMS